MGDNTTHSGPISDDGNLNDNLDMASTVGSQWGAGGKNYDSVNVLLLTFAYNDLNGLEKEILGAEAALQSLGYTVTTFSIPLVDTWVKLKKKLNSFFELNEDEESGGIQKLRIVYYYGHGNTRYNTEGILTLVLAGRNEPGVLQAMQSQYTFRCRTCATDADQGDGAGLRARLGLPGSGVHVSGLNAAQAWVQGVCIECGVLIPATVEWTDIADEIGKRPCDTLYILDCCNAGLAATSKEEDDFPSDYRYQKEFIGACGWNPGTASRMGPTIWSVLSTGLPKRLDSMSVSTLVRRVNNKLAQAGMAAPQAVHYFLERDGIGKMILPRLTTTAQRTSTRERRIYISYKQYTQEQPDAHGQLQGKSVLVLGGTSGIGKSVAIACALEGARVAIVYPPEQIADAASTQEVVHSLQSPGEVWFYNAVQDGDRVHYQDLELGGSPGFGSGFDVLVNDIEYKFGKDKGIDVGGRVAFGNLECRCRPQHSKFVGAALRYMKRGGIAVNTLSLDSLPGRAPQEKYKRLAENIEYLTRYQAKHEAYKTITVVALLPGPEWPLLADSDLQSALKVLGVFVSVVTGTHSREDLAGRTFDILDPK